MKFNQYLLFIPIIISIGSCSKIDLEEDAYFIFGQFYGECSGDTCIETYKLTREGLFEDQNDLLNGVYLGTRMYNFTPLSDEKFDLAKDILDFIPPELLTTDQHIFGHPDYSDQGGFYAEYRKDGITYWWAIDTDLFSLPTFTRPFARKIDEKVNLLE